MSETHRAGRARGARAVIVVAVVAVILAGILVVAEFVWGPEAVPAAAEVLTAVGTLALAWYTFSLARATRRSVDEAGAELEELRQQRELLKRQADTAATQATATARLADASRASARAAEKARVDAIAPLLYLEVRTMSIVVAKQGAAQTKMSKEWSQPSSFLPNLRFDVTLVLELKNVGAAPARLSFGDTSWFLENRQKRNLTGVVLEPGEKYVDRYIVRLFGDKATDGEFVKMPFTYEGTMHGEMFDRIQWNGWVTAAKVDGVMLVPHDMPVNSSGAQVIREYPNIERPEEMAAARGAIIDGKP